MDLGLEGKVAVVAASSQGIGRAAAEGFARDGARVVMNGRREDVLRRAADEIQRQTGAEVDAVVGDMSVARDAEALIDRALARFGSIDALVTNAGGPPSKRFEEIDDAAWEAAFHLTLMSAVRLIRHALPHLAETRGSVVNVTSYIVKQPDPVMVLSDALRVGVVALTRALATECAATGVRLNNVGPGLIWTERQRQLIEVQSERESVSFDEALHRREKSVPMQRFGTSQEMANIIVFLASPAAGYVTGQTLLVDGGLYRGLM